MIIRNVYKGSREKNKSTESLRVRQRPIQEPKSKPTTSMTLAVFDDRLQSLFGTKNERCNVAHQHDGVGFLFDVVMESVYYKGNAVQNYERNKP